MVDMDEKMNKFMLDLVKKHPTIPKDFDLFLITEETYIRFHNGQPPDMGKNYVDTVVLNPKKLELDRGQILSVFSKMEFLLNELIHLLVIDYDAKKRAMFNDVLENINFHRRIELLRKWGLINNSECGRMQGLKNVRNGFAHAWSRKAIFYKGQPIEKIFDDFKKDLKDTWLSLVAVYQNEQRKINLDEIREKLDLV